MCIATIALHVARDKGVILACSHIDRVSAQKMVECLQRLGLDYARVVEGVCDEPDPPSE